MKRWLWTAGIVAVLLLASWLFIAMRGAGGFKRMVTISGVYSVDMPDGVRCYINRDGGAMWCAAAKGAVKNDQ